MTALALCRRFEAGGSSDSSYEATTSKQAENHCLLRGYNGN